MASTRRLPQWRLLDGLSVNIFPVSNFEDRNLIKVIVDQVCDSVVALTNPIAIVVTSELLGAAWAGARRHALHLCDQALSLRLGANRGELLARGDLN